MEREARRAPSAHESVATLGRRIPSSLSFDHLMTNHGASPTRCLSGVRGQCIQNSDSIVNLPRSAFVVERISQRKSIFVRIEEARAKFRLIFILILKSVQDRLFNKMKTFSLNENCWRF